MRLDSCMISMLSAGGQARSFEDMRAEAVGVPARQPAEGCLPVRGIAKEKPVPEDELLGMSYFCR